MTDEQSPWSLYWQTAELHSCLATDKEKDQLLLEKQWYDFADLLKVGASVLDLATGNGSVPHALLERNSSLVIDAVDQAKIRPDLSVKHSKSLEKVKFYPDQDIIQLNESIFKPESYDALVSQFGAEYAGLPIVLEKCLKLIKPGGQLKFIIHHQDSQLLANSQRKLKELTHVLLDNGFVDTLVAWSNGNVGFEQLEKQGLDNIHNCSARSEQISGQIFEAVRQIAARAKSDPERGVEMATILKDRMLGEFQRLTQLISVAQSKNQILDLESIFIESGFNAPRVNKIEFDLENYLLAWNIEASRQ